MGEEKSMRNKDQSDWQKRALRKIDKELKPLISNEPLTKDRMKAAKTLKDVWSTFEFQKTLPSNLPQWDKIGDFTLDNSLSRRESI